MLAIREVLSALVLTLAMIDFPKVSGFVLWLALKTFLLTVVLAREALGANLWALIRRLSHSHVASLEHRVATSRHDFLHALEAFVLRRVLRCPARQLRDVVTAWELEIASDCLFAALLARLTTGKLAWMTAFGAGTLLPAIDVVVNMV